MRSERVIRILKIEKEGKKAYEDIQNPEEI